MKSYLGFKRPAARNAVKWAETKRAEATDDNDVSIYTDLTKEQSDELYYFLLATTTDEPRVGVKGAAGNGVDAWRQLKTFATSHTRR